MSFILGSILGVFIFGLVSWSAIRWNKERLHREYSYRLFPNCLITRFPIVFIHGRKSIFYFGNYWNFLPKFLIDHGYEVIDLDLPWRDETARKKELVRLLELLKEEGIGAHFIADITSARMMLEAEKEFPEVFRSNSIMGVRDMGVPSSGDEPFAFRLHRLITGRNSDLDGRVLGLTETCDLKDIGRIYLRKVVELAESDLHHGVQHEPGFNQPESDNRTGPQL